VEYLEIELHESARGSGDLYLERVDCISARGSGDLYLERVDCINQKLRREGNDKLPLDGPDRCRICLCSSRIHIGLL
jgi:hypothetical protein